MKIHFIVALLGFVIALFFSFYVFPKIQVPLNLSLDPDRYGEIACNIYSGSGFKYFNSISEATDKHPVYPYLLATIFYFSNGVNYDVVQIIQALFHSLTTLMIFYFVWSLTSYKNALIAQIILALHPILIWYTSRLWIESFYTFVFSATFILYIKTYNSLKLSHSIYSGLLTGITLLTKAVLLFFPFLLLFNFYLKKGNKGFKSALTIIMVAFIVLSPWIIRNYKVTGSLEIVHSNLGQNLILGNALAENWTKKPFSNLESWEKGYKKIQSILSVSKIETYSADENRILLKNYLETLIENPEFFIWRSFINFVTFWYISESAMKSVFFIIMQLPLLLIIIIGVRKLIQRFEFGWMLLSIIGYYSLVHALIIGWGRYSVPLIPLMIVIVVIILSKEQKQTRIYSDIYQEEKF